MPVAIPGIVPKGDGLVHNNRTPLIIALVPIMAKLPVSRTKERMRDAFLLHFLSEAYKGKALHPFRGDRSTRAD